MGIPAETILRDMTARELQWHINLANLRQSERKQADQLRGYRYGS